MNVLEFAFLVWAALWLATLAGFAGRGGLVFAGLLLGGAAAFLWWKPGSQGSLPAGANGAIVSVGALAGATALGGLVGLARLPLAMGRQVGLLLFLLAPLGVVGHDLYWVLQSRLAEEAEQVVEAIVVTSEAAPEERARRGGRTREARPLARLLGHPRLAPIWPPETRALGAMLEPLASLVPTLSQPPLALPSGPALARESSALSELRRSLEAAAAEARTLGHDVLLWRAEGARHVAKGLKVAAREHSLVLHHVPGAFGS